MTPIHKLIHWIIVIVLLVSFVNAIPVPHGVDGHIFELDGITPVDTDFQVMDLSTGQTIQGKTSKGYYSVSLDGNDGDIILIKTWNKYHSSNRTVVLNGVMHSVDLLLNTSLPPIQPKITSEPLLKANVNTLYEYKVGAYDENNDSLAYFIEGPENMSVDETGLVEWIPENVGNVKVKIIVTDGIFFVNQSYNITVEREIIINHAPVITSVPGTNGRVLRLYKYIIKAEDLDEDVLTYRLIRSPSNMLLLKSGIILWVPFPKHVGDNAVEIEVSDGSLSDYQIFNITVQPYVRPRLDDIFTGSPGGGLGGGGIFTTNMTIISTSDVEIEKTRSVIEEFVSRPENLKILEKNVYKYLFVESEEDYILFSVGTNWIDKRDKKEVVINYFAEDQWIELPTEIVEEYDDNIMYRANFASNGYYAISLRTVRIPVKLKVSGPDEPHVIAGKIFSGRSKQVRAGTRITIRNLKTKEKFEAKTGIGKDSGAYYMLVYGDRGDEIEVKAQKLFVPKRIIELKGDMRNIDLYQSTVITGAVVGVPTVSKYGDLAIAIILLIMSLYWRFQTVKKRMVDE